MEVVVAKAVEKKTPYGHTTAQDAALQVLILPAVILAWAIAVVTIGVIVG